MGRRLYSYQWEELPITDTFIDRVEEMVTSEEASENIDGYPNFEWSLGNPITNGYKMKMMINLNMNIVRGPKKKYPRKTK